VQLFVGVEEDDRLCHCWRRRLDTENADLVVSNTHDATRTYPSGGESVAVSSTYVVGKVTSSGSIFDVVGE
jgi:hypothetical protein